MVVRNQESFINIVILPRNFCGGIRPVRASDYHVAGDLGKLKCKAMKCSTTIFGLNNEKNKIYLQN